MVLREVKNVFFRVTPVLEREVNRNIHTFISAFVFLHFSDI